MAAIQNDWLPALRAEFKKPYYAKLYHFIEEEYRTGTVYPAADRIFEALTLTPLEKVRVVILGQDPYHGPRQAQGLSFSVPDDIPAPPSLQNILKELADDIGVKESHDLTSWAQQGVLLLNAGLTVPAGQANAHAGLIWEPFTDAIIKVVNAKTDSVVFILWGSYARKKKALISNSQHLIIESAHPSPLSAYRGFFGSKPFSRTNDFLVAKGLEPIDWLA